MKERNFWRNNCFDDVAKRNFGKQLLNNLELLTQIVDTHQDISNQDEENLKVSKSKVLEYFNLGLEYFESGEIEKAKREFINSLTVNENFLDANFNLGVLYRDDREYNNALSYFTKCNEIEPQNFTILFNIAFCYEMLKQFNEAVEFYKKAEELSSASADLYFNLGNIYKELKNWEIAKEEYSKSLSIDAQNTECLLNYASTFYFTGLFEKAISIYNQILAMEPNNFSAKMNCAAALVEIGELNEAQKMYEALLSTNYKDTELHYNLAVLHLLLGNMEKGLTEYEWRLKNKEKYNSYPEIPFWNNEKLSGKSIVVIDEQGTGDVFQFVRYLSVLKESGAKVIFSCRTHLVEFMNSTVVGTEMTDAIVPLTETIEADYKIYLMSLPLKLLQNKFNSKQNFPYLNPNTLNTNWFSDFDLLKNSPLSSLKREEAICKIRKPIPNLYSIGGQEFAEKFQFDENKFNIGIVWRGSPEHLYDFKRSVKLSDISKLFSVKGASVYSLQKDITTEERNLLRANYCEDLSSKLISFRETSKIIEKLDLIISVDTAVAHLAGALNKKTFVLLSKIPDWRWGLESEETQLYPSLKLFRQKTVSVWNDVVDDIYLAVQNCVKSKLGVSSTFDSDTVELKSNGLKSIELKDYNSAINWLNKYCAKEKDDFEASYWLSVAYFELQNYNKAESILLELTQKTVLNFEVNTLLGKLYLINKRFSESEYFYGQALVYGENNDVINGIGVALQKQGKFVEAGEFFSKAISLDGNNAGNQINYANNCYYLKRYEEADMHFNYALDIANISEAHVGKSILYLTQKLFEEGFKEYEWSLTEFKIPDNCKAVKWTGQSGAGKNIFIYTEQGLGDSIQFVRFLKQVKDKGFNITVSCPQVLKTLFKTIPFIDNFCEQISSDMDYYSSIINLPKALKLVSEQDMALPDCIFNVEEKPNHTFEKSLSKEKLNVGLVWETKSKQDSIVNRNINLQTIEKLFENQNIEFYVLQKDYKELNQNQLLEKYPNLTFVNMDLSELADLIKNLDLVISIDSMAANLAGSLRTETWVLLPYISDWRWQQDGNTSYWYPTVKLFRQPKINDWESVISKINSALISKKKLLKKEQIDSNNIIEVIKLLLNENKIEKAKDKLLIYLEEFPNDIEGNFFLGYVFHLQNNFENAAKCYSKVLSIAPTHIDALNNLGVVLKDLGKFEEALNFLEYAFQIDNTKPSVYNNMGIVCDLLGQFDKALLNFEEAVSLNPNYEEALLNYANTLQTKREYSKAISTLNNLIKINSNHVGAHFNKSLTFLSMGKYKQGFELYEWRRKRSDFYGRDFSKPELTNQNITGKTILVYDEQGLGDTIQFCRYINKLSECGARVILQCHAALSELLVGCKGVDYVLARKSLSDTGIEYDYHIPLLSLPRYFGSELDSVPNAIPYIEVSQELIANFRRKYFDNGKINIGIVWEGKTPLNNSQRACPLENYLCLKNDNEINLFSLQKGDVAIRDKQKMKDYNITDLSAELKTFNETAAILKNLDLVITIDTSVAHLAGALGVKTFTILSYKTDWRWLNNESSTVWYPDMLLIRQSVYGEWNNVFEKIIFLLKSMKWISKNNNNNNNKRS